MVRFTSQNKMDSSEPLLSKLKTFDAYAKTLDDFKVKTTTGALISLTSLLTVFLLVLSEYLSYTHITTQQQLVVDHSRRERLQIYLNITFPRLPCDFVSMDVMDVVGEQQNELLIVTKVPLDEDGSVLIGRHDVKQVERKDLAPANECGNCYGAAPSQYCCNTCDAVRAVYANLGWAIEDYSKIEQCVREGFAEKYNFKRHEGCMIYGNFTVNKVAGNFHFAPGHSFSQSNMHVHDMQAFAGHLDQVDFSHRIEYISFGHRFHALNAPLDNYIKERENGENFFQYFIKIVPTKITLLNGTGFDTNQFSATQHKKAQSTDKQQGGSMPGVFFNYDISPMMVTYVEQKRSFASFLTGICAIVGGVFTIASLADTFMYSAERALKKKVELGKNS